MVEDKDASVYKAIARGVVEDVAIRVDESVRMLSGLSVEVEAALQPLRDIPGGEGKLVRIRLRGTGWAVEANEDGTEGRGRQIIRHVAEMKATALRLAKGADVQGRDADVVEWPLLSVTVKLDGAERTWLYGPVSLALPTTADDAVEKRLALELEAKARREEILKQAKARGMTDYEIEMLRG